MQQLFDPCPFQVFALVPKVGGSTCELLAAQPASVQTLQLPVYAPLSYYCIRP